MRVFFVFFATLLWYAGAAQAHTTTDTFSARLCAQGDTERYHCVTLEKKTRLQGLAAVLNRNNTLLPKGSVVALPKEGVTKDTISPFPKIDPSVTEPTLIFDPSDDILGWAFYDADSLLIDWGPAVGGKGYCPDIKRSCRTRAGEYTVLELAGANRRSDLFPRGCSGNTCAPMPWYTRFTWSGLGFHGGRLPGQHDSHGCIRLFLEDARHINTTLVRIGTKVIVRPYSAKVS